MKFGWVVTGEVNTTCISALSFIGEACEEEYWALHKDDLLTYGSASRTNNKCKEERNALRHFEETSKRDETGRFVSRLPLKPLEHELGSTIKMATSRFLSVERRLQRDDDLEEYLKMGHMEEVENEKYILEPDFYLPHHPVIKSTSLTTKLRVIFDASANLSNLSLNDVLMYRAPIVKRTFDAECGYTGSNSHHVN